MHIAIILHIVQKCELRNSHFLYITKDLKALNITKLGNTTTKKNVDTLRIWCLKENNYINHNRYLCSCLIIFLFDCNYYSNKIRYLEVIYIIIIIIVLGIGRPRSKLSVVCQLLRHENKCSFLHTGNKNIDRVVLLSQYTYNMLYNITQLVNNCIVGAYTKSNITFYSTLFFIFKFMYLPSAYLQVLLT